MDLSGRLSNQTDLLHQAVNSITGRRRSTKPVARQPQHRLDPDETNELLTYYRAGASVRETVACFGLHRTTVLALLERHGVPRRPHVRKLTDRQLERGAEMYAAGQSLKTVGMALQVDAETVRKAFIRAGVELRPRPGRPRA